MQKFGNNRDRILSKILLLCLFFGLLVAEELPYNYSPQALYYPEKLSLFTQDSNSFEIETQNKKFSLKNSWWFANLAHLAYFDKDKIKQKLKKIGFKFETFYDINGTQAFIASSKKILVVSFRGTQIDEKKDLLTDIDIFLTTIKGDAQVHRGFVRGYNMVKNQIIQKLKTFQKKGYKLYFTGHSLGASLALLLATDVKPTAVYTFGSPRMGDEKFVKLFENIKVYRVVNGCDIVPSLPFTGEMFLHIGQMWFFNYEGKIFSEPSQETVIMHNSEATILYFKKMALFRKDYLLFRTFADHSICNYTTSITKNLEIGRIYATHTEK